jgi:hypothetical protein
MRICFVAISALALQACYTGGPVRVTAPDGLGAWQYQYDDAQDARDAIKEQCVESAHGRPLHGYEILGTSVERGEVTTGMAYKWGSTTTWVSRTRPTEDKYILFRCRDTLTERTY